MDIACLRCGQPETIGHVLFLCPFAVEVWRLFAPFSSITFDPDMFLGDIYQLLGQARNLPPYGVCYPLFPWLCWELWKARNLLTFEATSMIPEEVLSRAIRAAREWELASCLVQQPSVESLLVAGPDRPVVTCCVDASVHIERRIVGLGWVFFDDTMNLMHQNSSSRVGIKSVLVGEGLAMRCAVQEAITMGLRSVMFQTDSASLVALLRDPQSHLELNGKMQLEFDFILFRFIPRAANAVADAVAKSVLTGIG